MLAGELTTTASHCLWVRWETGTMRRNLFTPSTMAVPSPPDPLLLFIQRAQLSIYYEDRRSEQPLPRLQAVPGADRKLAW